MIRTERMELVAGTAELGRAEVTGRAALAEALGADVPEGWPPENARDVVEPFAARLRRDPALAGWLNWYLIRADPATGRRTLIGSAGFTAPPADGVVAVGYALLPEYRGKGYATEAVRALVAWAFTHPDVRKVIAEALPDNAPSLRVLARAGFSPVPGASEPGHVRFAITRAETETS